MPYINQDDRKLYDKSIQQILHVLEIGKCDAPGNLNYVLSSVIWELFEKDKSYAKANELMGVLECVKQEFYRRQVVAYEEEKIKQNGDLNVIRGTTEHGDNYEIIKT